MSKTYSKSELAKKAEGTFKIYPEATSMFATNDGQIFLEENRAELHKKSLGKKGQYFEIENEGISSDDGKGSDKKSANDLIEESKTLDLEATEAALKVEQALDKPRKTVLAAYDERIDELKTDK